LLKRLAAIATARAKFDAVFCSVARLRRVVLLLSEAYLIFDKDHKGGKNVQWEGGELIFLCVCNPKPSITRQVADVASLTFRRLLYTDYPPIPRDIA
jgi:hypothetical protein